MDDIKQRVPESLGLLSKSVCGALIGLLMFVGVGGIWPVIANSLDQKEVGVEVVDTGYFQGSDPRRRFMVYWIEVEGDGFGPKRVNVDKKVYQSFFIKNKDGLRLVRERWFGTPVSLVYEKGSMVKFEKGSILEKLVGEPKVEVVEVDLMERRWVYFGIGVVFLVGVLALLWWMRRLPWVDGMAWILTGAGCLLGVAVGILIWV